MQNRSLTSFTVLSFDIYGTLIDWETGIQNALTDLAGRLDASNPLRLDRVALGAAFNKHERATQAQNPSMTYDIVLKTSYEVLARDLDALPTKTSETDDVDALLDAEGSRFAAAIADWPAFPDTVGAMRELKKRGYKLVPLSNVDRVSFSKSLHGPLAGLHEGLRPDQPFFDAVYTAQDVGSYKPALRNFEYLLQHIRDDFGVEKEDILHVAQSLFHDHEPAKKVGLQSAWIARGDSDGGSSMGGDVGEYVGGADGGDAKVAFGWKFKDLKGLVEAIEREEAERKQ